MERAVRGTSWIIFPKTIQMISLCHSLLPGLIRLSDGSPFWGNNDLEVAFCVLAFAMNFFHVSNNFSFMVIGIRDYARRLTVMNHLAAMLEPEMKVNTKEPMPLLMFECPASVYHWQRARRILKDIGLQYFLRIQAFFSLYTIAGIALIVFFFIQLIGSEFERMTIAIVSIDIITLLFIALVMISLAQSINRQAEEHGYILLKKEADLHRRIIKEECASETGEYRNTAGLQSARHVSAFSLLLLQC